MVIFLEQSALACSVRSSTRRTAGRLPASQQNLVKKPEVKSAAMTESMEPSTGLLHASERQSMKENRDPSGFRKVGTTPSPFSSKQEVALLTHALSSFEIPSEKALDERFSGAGKLHEHAQLALKLDSLNRHDVLGLNEQLESFNDNSDHYSSDFDSRAAETWRMSAMSALWGSDSGGKYGALMSQDALSGATSAEHATGLSIEVEDEDEDEDEDAMREMRKETGGTYAGAAKEAIVSGATSVALSMMRAWKRVTKNKFIWSKETKAEKAGKEKVVDKPMLRIAPLAVYMEKPCY